MNQNSQSLEPRPNFQDNMGAWAFRRKSSHQSRVETFMKMAGQVLPDKPTIPDAKVRELRVRLLLEEVLETADALGVKVSLSGQFDSDPPLSFDEFIFTATDDVDLVWAVDGLADISVVTVGALSALGVADMAILEEVDRHNLGKFGPGSYKDENGKWRKPPGFVPPDFASVLRAQGWTQSTGGVVNEPDKIPFQS